ncbi:hypothetical protein PAECIP111891_02838 [Paenibacillus allorhizoplanae]|uniref:Uncharacterized protein n=1 Tax=Paenibacillus allorhizoplanae TaxID=2905648 RepID=A0ABN8GDD4_9BACL|nr:hypothetical protein PAECIP111891_02838 [Paenibacillus allorhizoplanae]
MLYKLHHSYVYSDNSYVNVAWNATCTEREGLIRGYGVTENAGVRGGSAITGYGLRVTGYGLRATGYGLRVTGYGCVMAVRRSRVMDHGLQLRAYSFLSDYSFKQRRSHIWKRN